MTEVIIEETAEPTKTERSPSKILLLVAVLLFVLFTGLMYLCVESVIHPPSDEFEFLFDILFPKYNIGKISTPPTSSPSLDSQKPLSQNILSLDATALDNAKKPSSTTFWVVKFFRENCPHCKRLAPDFAKLADNLSTIPNLRFGEVDCLSKGDLCNKNKIEGVPTIKIFYKGSMRVHFEGRDVATLTKWIEDSMANDGEHVKHPPPPPPPPPPPEPSKPLTESVVAFDAASLAAAKADPNNFMVVLFFRVNCPHCARFRPDYSKVADGLKNTPNLLFGEVDCPANGPVCNQHQIRGVPSLKIFYKNAVLVHEGPRDVQSVTKWIQDSIANNGELIKNPPPSPSPSPPPPPG